MATSVLYRGELLYPVTDDRAIGFQCLPHDAKPVEGLRIASLGYVFGLKAAPQLPCEQAELAFYGLFASKISKKPDLLYCPEGKRVFDTLHGIGAGAARSFADLDPSPGGSRRQSIWRGKKAFQGGRPQIPRLASPTVRLDVTF